MGKDSVLSNIGRGVCAVIVLSVSPWMLQASLLSRFAFCCLALVSTGRSRGTKGVPPWVRSHADFFSLNVQVSSCPIKSFSTKQEQSPLFSTDPANLCMHSSQHLFTSVSVKEASTSYPVPHPPTASSLIGPKEEFAL